MGDLECGAGEELCERTSRPQRANGPGVSEGSGGSSAFPARGGARARAVRVPSRTPTASSPARNAGSRSGSWSSAQLAALTLHRDRLRAAWTTSRYCLGMSKSENSGSASLTARPAHAPSRGSPPRGRRRCALGSPDKVRYDAFYGTPLDHTQVCSQVTHTTPSVAGTEDNPGLRTSLSDCGPHTESLANDALIPKRYRHAQRPASELRTHP